MSSDNILYARSIFTIHATCITHFILLDVTTLTILGEESNL
jgi:hypothetical protein